MEILDRGGLPSTVRIDPYAIKAPAHPRGPEGDAAATGRFVSAGQRWEAVRTRDRHADGHFVYAVRTTGVYCRPSSSARLPRRANVEFFDTALAAEAAGYRPSRRYSGDRSASAERRASLVTTACRLIEASDQPPTLVKLGERVGMSPFHFQRMFKAEVGVSPKAYGLASRARKLRQQLGNREASTTDAIFEAGFNSSGHFYATAGRHLGMPADAFRNGGAGISISYALCECSLGLLLVARGYLGVCAILLGADVRVLIAALEAQFPRAFLMRGDQAHEERVKRVIALVDASRAGLGLPLDVRATAFQERVRKVFRLGRYCG